MPRARPEPFASKFATLIRLRDRARERLDNGTNRLESPFLVSVTGRYSSAHRVRCIPEYTREGTISWNGRVRVLFPFRYAKTFRAALSVPLPLCDLYGLTLFSSVIAEKNVSHSLSFSLILSLSLSLSLSFFLSQQGSQIFQRRGCTNICKRIRSIDFKVLSLPFFSLSLSFYF